MAKPKKPAAKKTGVRKLGGIKALPPVPLKGPLTDREKFKIFLVNNAEYSLLGYWLTPHIRFVLYKYPNKCGEMWHVYRWQRDEPTNLTCTCDGVTHHVVRAFFLH